MQKLHIKLYLAIFVISVITFGLPTELSAFGSKTKCLELPMPFDKTFDLCVASIAPIKGHIKKEDRALGQLKAKTNMSWWSYGETIQINLHKLDEKTTEIKITSKPKLATNVVDWGKNSENVEKISKFLTNHN